MFTQLLIELFKLNGCQRSSISLIAAESENPANGRHSVPLHSTSGLHNWSVFGVWRRNLIRKLQTELDERKKLH